MSSILEIPELISKANANLKWLINNYEMLVEKYPDKVVAVDHENYVDSDDKQDELIKRLSEKGLLTNTLLMQFIPNKNTTITL